MHDGAPARDAGGPGRARYVRHVTPDGAAAGAGGAPPGRDPRRAPGIGPRALLALAVELALVALVAVAGWRLGPGGTPSFTVAAVLVAVLLRLWGRFLAPRAAHRLPPRARTVVTIALYLGAGAFAASTGLVGWGVAVAVVGVASTLWARG